MSQRFGSTWRMRTAVTLWLCAGLANRLAGLAAVLDRLEAAEAALGEFHHHFPSILPAPPQPTPVLRARLEHLVITSGYRSIVELTTAMARFEEELGRAATQLCLALPPPGTVGGVSDQRREVRHLELERDEGK